MSNARIINADCLAALRDMPDASVDAVVTDPPYGLSNTRPEQVAETITRWVTGDREYLPSGRGFMGHEWDGFVPPVAVWDECLRVLKPGGHLLAFAGSRTHDLMTLGIRLAGFEIRDSVAWLYGSGFPKSLDVSKAIDKRGGNAHMAHEIGQAIKAARIRRGWTVRQADRHFCGGSTNWTWYEGRKGEVRPPSPADFERIVSEWPELAPLAESVAAAEREVVGRGQSGPASVAFTRDSGGTYDVTAAHSDAAREWEGWGTALKPAFEPVTLARKPLNGTVAANVLEHGTGALNIDACRVGSTVETWPKSRARPNNTQDMHHDYTGGGSHTVETGPAPAGRWPANVMLDESQAAELDRQSGNVKSGGNSKRHKRASPNWGGYSGGSGIVSGAECPPSEGGASRFFYVAKAGRRERPEVDGVKHPTVKPLALMRHLCRLVTPPGGVILEPFAGSGTTVEAAMLEGFDVVGIEREADYLPLIQARIERATTKREARAEAEGGALFPIDGDAS